MKILITSGIFPPDIGGPATYVPKIAQHMVNSGHEVRVLTYSDNSKTFDKYPFKLKRIKRHFLPVRILKFIIVGIYYGINTDIIYSNTAVLESTVINIFCRKKLVSKVVGDYAWERCRSKNLTKLSLDNFIANRSFDLRVIILTYIRNTYYRQSDLIIVPSEYLKMIVNKSTILSDKVEVIYNGMSFPKIERLNVKRKKGQFVYVGRLTNWKGLTGLISAFNMFPELELLVLGTGPEESDLKSIAKRNITFYGLCDKNEVFDKVIQSECLILNSEYEGLPHVLLEALYLNTPIASNEAGGCKEVILDGKFGYPLRGEEQLRVEVFLSKYIKSNGLILDRLRGFNDHPLREQLTDKYMLDRTAKSIERLCM